jgi:hypothetical protein
MVGALQASSGAQHTRVFRARTEIGRRGDSSRAPVRGARQITRRPLATHDPHARTSRSLANRRGLPSRRALAPVDALALSARSRRARPTDSRAIESNPRAHEAAPIVPRSRSVPEPTPRWCA